jgi:uncharacterized membrane protein
LVERPASREFAFDLAGLTPGAGPGSSSSMPLISKRGRNVSRIEAFSDAVFAISATLLVVSLEVPSDFNALLRELRGFLPFGISFGALVLIWCVHNAFFRRYGLTDGVTIAINAVLLFVVMFFVFPLKYMAGGFVSFVSRTDAGGVRLESVEQLGHLFMIYGAAFVAVFACVSLLYYHAWRCREGLALNPEEAAEASTLARHYVIFVFVGLLSIGVAWAGWGTTYGFPGFLYAVLGPLCYAHGKISERRAASAA